MCFTACFYVCITINGIFEIKTLIMTPKEKAKCLLLKYENMINYDFISDLNWHNPMDKERNNRVKKDAKNCAYIAIEEIIEQNNIWIMRTGKGTNNYWEEVKQEIEKL